MNIQDFSLSLFSDLLISTTGLTGIAYKKLGHLYLHFQALLSQERSMLGSQEERKKIAQDPAYVALGALQGQQHYAFYILFCFVNAYLCQQHTWKKKSEFLISVKV